MSKKNKDVKNIHYINPNYSMKINGERHAVNKRLSSNSENIKPTLHDENLDISNNLPQPKTNPLEGHEVDFAFRGDSQMLESYNYMPYYNEQIKEDEK